MNLLEQLKAEHREILSALQEIEQIGAGKRQARSKLMQVRDLLKRHLEREDQDLYPALWDAAESNDNLQTLVLGHQLDRRNVTRFVIHFFERYEDGDLDMSFRKDCQRLLKLLHQRIEQEETTLYREFERHLKIPFPT